MTANDSLYEKESVQPARQEISSAPGGPPPHRPADDGIVQLLGEPYYVIRHVDRLPPFLMSVVSSGDHWLFVASNGGLTAGRTNANRALLPYETEDKIVAHHDLNGCVTMLRIADGAETRLWEPFSERYPGIYRCDRHLYKNLLGNKVVFEEINHDLGLTFRYAWRTGDRFGFVRSCWLENHGEKPLTVDLLDGLQNVLPAGIDQSTANNLSSLLNAYKRSELHPETGLGIFALSATLSDAAEPSESLRATVVWQTGLTPDAHLLSGRQLDPFRHGADVTPEHDVRGRAGAYLCHSRLTLAPGARQSWHVVADVHRDGAAVVDLLHHLQRPGTDLVGDLEADIERGSGLLLRYVAGADGLQDTADRITSAHHFANVLFNIMRGGIFTAGYQVESRDLRRFVRDRNRPVLTRLAGWFDQLPPRLSIDELYRRAADQGDPDLVRLCYEYLPLTFSRRHGDPSRPWNHFAINLVAEDGTPRLDYQGNWRDIFQNWEPLLLAYPRYLPGIIAKFLNATTADGYNPYRVTREGIEWETPDPDDPWANIGYWNDHQIIYLQKLLELAAEVDPDLQRRFWHAPVFTYADVPYRQRSYREMLGDWYNTIDFDEAHHAAIMQRVAKEGSDGRLLRGADGGIIHVTMLEKLLVLLLAKLCNLVPDGGIWMNTQRPEWNDANNALVGKGLSVVTTAYLLRFVTFWQKQLAAADAADYAVNDALAELLTAVNAIFEVHASSLTSGFDEPARRAFMDAMGGAATRYRTRIYAGGPPAAQQTVSAGALDSLLAHSRRYLTATLHANRRPDGLFHTYNVLQPTSEGTAISRLYLMLEGQVAILSAGLLTPAEAVTLLTSLRHSTLYRADQHSYLLYPDRDLPGFLAKNNVPAERLAASRLVATLDAAGDPRLLVADDSGTYHFNGDFRNAGDVARTLDVLAEEPAYAPLVKAERDALLALFEETFNHAEFTGRSGTFFAYEGLGSIYWHMVAKLLLAVQEVYFAARSSAAPETAALAAAYHDIRQGLGFNKTPAEYGAFPADPYSHTPAAGGARQPGMTGLVKEEILTRWGELGVALDRGGLRFTPTLLAPDELFSVATTFRYVDVAGQEQTLTLPVGSLGFTFCQTPVIYAAAVTPAITVHWSDGRRERLPGTLLPPQQARHLFQRTGHIQRLEVDVVLPDDRQPPPAGE